MQLEDEIVRRVIDRVDLLQHDFSFQLQITLSKQRVEYEIGKHVCSDIDVLVEDACLI